MKKIIILVLTTTLLLFLTPETKATTFDKESNTSIENIISNNYYQVLNTWYNEGLRDDIEFKDVISPSSFQYDNINGSVTVDTTYQEYLITKGLSNQTGEVFSFNQTITDPQSISMSVDIDSEGLYKLGIDYYSETTTIGNIDIEIKINGESPYYEASQVIIPTYWSTPNTFNLDRYGNDIMPNANQVYKWEQLFIRDSTKLFEQAILFKLDAGINEIEITRNNGYFKLGQVYVENMEVYQSYEDYLNESNSIKVTNELIEIEGEDVAIKNDVSIRYSTDRNPRNTPFGLIQARLNVLDGATFHKSGQAIFYDVDVTQTGLYQISLKSRQDKNHTRIFRTVTIDGKVPFKEAERVYFSSSGWINKTLSIEGEPMWFYLTEGTHRIGLEVNSAPYREIYQNISEVMRGVNDIALDIKKLTGNQIDENRDWDITEFMPNLSADLKAYGRLINDSYDEYKEISKTGKDAEIAAGLKSAFGWLYDLSDHPNDVPKNINRLTGPTSSVLQRLGIVLPLVIDSPLTIDKLYVHGDDVKLPAPNPGFFEGIWYEIQRFFASFFSNQFGISNNPEELNIWVNRSRQYANLMQQMADDVFTPETGIVVNISLMPNEDKLILATSSGTQPDLAMGVAGWRPYDFAIRNAVEDLSKFDGFLEMTESFEAGSFMQLIYQDGVYGIPETQNFNILFYRRDILNSLSLDVPDTWNDVLDMLPELQRFGMNFYSMLSSSTAFKSFSTTMPFIMQHGGNLYKEGALSTALDSEEAIAAMTLMTDLFTVYALPLEVGSFYNQFRFGNIPVGIGDFGMYIQLLFAAPEIAGLWGIAPLPGIEKDGIVDRSYDGASTSSMIFKNSNKKDEAWRFLQWWMSANTQISYSENLLTAYGPEYMWNSANVDAFSGMNINRDHKEIFLTQWKWVLDTAKTPASYMLEREISNAWNRVVYDGINVRTAMEDAEVLVNKEINRKMIEFQFIDNSGKVLKPYLLPTKENLEDWVVGYD